MALIEAFQSVPIRFIESVFKEHSHFYGAYFAILEAERSHGSAAVPPYDKLRSKRGRVRTTSLILMDQLRQEGHDFDGLKQEIDCAFQRRKRDNGTYENVCFGYGNLAMLDNFAVSLSPNYFVALCVQGEIVLDISYSATCQYLCFWLLARNEDHLLRSGTGGIYF